jgi:sulfite exporter TauE/SafE
MSATLAISALLMGLAGGPHCAAMCGAACGAITGPGSHAPISLSRLRERAGVRAPSRRLFQFQAGRLLGYSLAGAAAAGAVENFAWLTANTAPLRPLWTLFHLAVLAWGLSLAVMARQPVWVGSAGRAVWSRLRPAACVPGGVFATGALWTFMPCGLLYSALLVASLSGGPLDGARSMALFALGSALSLSLAPVLLSKLRQAGNKARQDWGTRAAGLLLVLASLWSLWMDMAHRVAVWCGLA